MLDWLQKTQPQEEYILIIDADMIMRTPMLPQELGAGPGVCKIAHAMQLHNAIVFLLLNKHCSRFFTLSI